MQAALFLFHIFTVVSASRLGRIRLGNYEFGRVAAATRPATGLRRNEM